MMEEFAVSRRQILTVAGLALGVGVVDLGPAGPAAAAPAGITLEPVAADPVAILTGENAPPAAVPRQLAVRVLRGAGMPAGAQLTTTFDPRVYAPLTPGVLVHRGRSVATTGMVAIDPATGRPTSTITLTEPVPADGELIAIIGTANPMLYPYDLVRRPAEPTARAGHARRDLGPDRPAPFGGPAEPWGVEVSGVWAARTWGPGDRYRYHVPVRVTLTGAGPARGPAASFSVTLDPRLVRAVTIGSARLDDRAYAGRFRRVSQSRTSSAHRTLWQAPVGLAAGQSLDIELRVDTVRPPGPLTGLTHPLVAAVTTGAAGAQRHTGRESLTRTDAVSDGRPQGVM
ncbi:hypothetical protein AB0J83_12115 [Actinoplanes sp. NPDC049596]|uniref:hypothetical protein n=1 Tax=unclassified Actinoplanes TaxID=2626549 RepID=UPI0034179164